MVIFVKKKIREKFCFVCILVYMTRVICRLRLAFLLKFAVFCFVSLFNQIGVFLVCFHLHRTFQQDHIKGGIQIFWLLFQLHIALVVLLRFSEGKVNVLFFLIVIYLVINLNCWVIFLVFWKFGLM